MRFAARQASIMCCASATEAAIGFSHSTCLPAAAARAVKSACIALGSTM